MEKNILCQFHVFFLKKNSWNWFHRKNPNTFQKTGFLIFFFRESNFTKFLKKIHENVLVHFFPFQTLDDTKGLLDKYNLLLKRPIFLCIIIWGIKLYEIFWPFLKRFSWRRRRLKRKKNIKNKGLYYCFWNTTFLSLFFGPSLYVYKGGSGIIMSSWCIICLLIFLFIFCLK